MIRVLLADDHTIVRQGLVSILTASGECQIVAEAANGIDATKLALEHQPQVAVIDMTMPGLNGMEVVNRIHQHIPDCKVLVLTMHEEEEYVIHAVRAGAKGYLLKDSASTDLLDAVKALATGKSYFGQYAAQVLAEQTQHTFDHFESPYRNLTEREREVFHLVVDGKSTKDIARLLNISPKTAENHRGKIMEKLKLSNVAELVRYAAKKGLLD